VTRTRVVVVLSPPTSCATCAPPIPNQLVNILVKNRRPAGSQWRLSAFRYGSQIIITAISPGEGPATGGTLVTVFGQGFDEPVAVSMGDHAQQVISVSRQRDRGAYRADHGYDLRRRERPRRRWTNIETGASATGPCFIYRSPRPIISGISPSSGPQGGGTNVTISGVNFASPLTVSFGTNAGTVNSVSSSSVSATTPPFPASIFTTEVCRRQRRRHERGQVRSRRRSA
jgi:hypothetical protein